MFSNEFWIYPQNRPNARELYASILYPQLWEMGEAEAEAREVARENWKRPESYLFYQPNFGRIL